MSILSVRTNLKNEFKRIYLWRYFRWYRLFLNKFRSIGASLSSLIHKLPIITYILHLLWYTYRSKISASLLVVMERKDIARTCAYNCLGLNLQNNISPSPQPPTQFLPPACIIGLRRRQQQQARYKKSLVSQPALFLSRAHLLFRCVASLMYRIYRSHFTSLTPSLTPSLPHNITIMMSSLQRTTTLFLLEYFLELYLPYDPSCLSVGCLVGWLDSWLVGWLIRLSVIIS